MGNVYAIADLHFGHENMAIARGFNSIEEHDNYIIASWNKIVRKHDTVYLIGDITHEKPQFYNLLNQLLGHKKVVLGNHEKLQHIKELLTYVNSVCGMLFYDRYILTHCPIHPSQISNGRINIHGHTHAHSLEDKRYYSVSCEVVDYTPVLIKNIILDR